MATASRIRAGIPRHHNPRIQDAIDEVWNSDGKVISVGAKKKGLHKFGENLLVGTGEATLMTLPSGVTEETYATDNDITHVSSSSGSDTQVWTVEGHTLSGGEFTFVIQSVTLTGQTKAALGTPLARVTRMYNTGSAANVGVIYAFEDDTLTGGVPDTAAKVHLMVPIGENQSLKASTTISSADYWLIEKMYASLTEKAAGFAVLRLRVREYGGTWRTLFKRSVQSQGSDLDMELPTVVIVPANADVRMTAEADAGNTPVVGGIVGRLASVVADSAND